jgi:uncharacterized sodium:solute symporter family permease YidK
MFTFLLSVSLYYNVLNQFMIQRVLGAKDMYHARVGVEVLIVTDYNSFFVVGSLTKWMSRWWWVS